MWTVIKYILEGEIYGRILTRFLKLFLFFDERNTETPGMTIYVDLTKGNQAIKSDHKRTQIFGEQWNGFRNLIALLTNRLSSARNHFKAKTKYRSIVIFS